MGCLASSPSFLLPSSFCLFLCPHRRPILPTWLLKGPRSSRIPSLPTTRYQSNRTTSSISGCSVATAEMTCCIRCQHLHQHQHQHQHCCSFDYTAVQPNPTLTPTPTLTLTLTLTPTLTQSAASVGVDTIDLLPPEPLTPTSTRTTTRTTTMKTRSRVEARTVLGPSLPPWTTTHLETLSSSTRLEDSVSLHS